MTSKEGMTDSKKSTRERSPRTVMRQSQRGKIAALVVILGAVVLLTVALVPASDTTLATPTREGGNCSNCHPFRTTTFLSTSGLPVGSYTPGHVYTGTVTLADANGATGENSFDFILSAGGGTLATTDLNAEINSATEASANDGVSPMSTSQWTVQWTAPASGTVTINLWSVMDETGATGINAPYDHTTTTLTAGAAIPEFPTILIPVVGIGFAVVIAIMITRRSA